MQSRENARALEQESTETRKHEQCSLLPSLHDLQFRNCSNPKHDSQIFESSIITESSKHNNLHQVAKANRLSRFLRNKLNPLRSIGARGRVFFFFLLRARALRPIKALRGGAAAAPWL